LEIYKLKLDTNTINKIAKLARIRLSDKEANEFLKDINSILDWVEQLNEVNTDKIDPLTNISSSALTKRKDEAQDMNSSDEILQNSPDKLEGYFAVPKVVE
jgi:aspartyl-tRNA(Asn)/glutamyl-tRNA(Gln) amidotransferase subunit C